MPVLLFVLLAGLFAIAAWSQEELDSEPDASVRPEAATVRPEAATVQPETEDEADVADDEQDEVVVDDEYYQDVDDEDFRPSEDVPADQSIAFPTDI